jgi:uncharacterized protein (UPF0548 family)
MPAAPTPDLLEACLAEWTRSALSYPHDASMDHPLAQGFLIDHHEARLGTGSAVFQRAAAALEHWTMFALWARVVRRRTVGQAAGEGVAMVVRLAGLCWINPCRILHRCDALRSHGFAYGTLPGHAECGEEQFIVEWRNDDSVWYVIRAFSRPQHPLAWIGFPVTRW